jgi:hypothetical protein
MQITIWRSVPKDSITGWEIKNNITYTLQGPQVLGWAACKCPLHCPGLSLLRDTSRLSPQCQADKRGGGCPGWRGSGPCLIWAKQGTSLHHTDFSCIAHWTQLYILMDWMGPLTPDSSLSGTVLTTLLPLQKLVRPYREFVKGLSLPCDI